MAWWQHSLACRKLHLLSPAELKSGTPEAAAAAAAAGAAAGGRGAGPSEPPAPPYEGDVDPISKDDYFLKNAEFAAWLRESRGKFFRCKPGRGAPTRTLAPRRLP
jgi:hypothetical protein